MDGDDTLLAAVCTQLYQIQLVFLIAVVFLLLSIVVLIGTEPGTPVFIVTTMNVVGLTAFALVFGSLSFLCNRG